MAEQSPTLLLRIFEGIGKLVGWSLVALVVGIPLFVVVGSIESWLFNLSTFADYGWTLDAALIIVLVAGAAIGITYAWVKHDADERVIKSLYEPCPRCRYSRRWDYDPGLEELYREAIAKADAEWQDLKQVSAAAESEAEVGWRRERGEEADADYYEMLRRMQLAGVVRPSPRGIRRAKSGRRPALRRRSSSGRCRCCHGQPVGGPGRSGNRRGCSDAILPNPAGIDEPNKKGSPAGSSKDSARMWRIDHVLSGGL